MIDLVGKRFNKLLVISLSHKTKSRVYWSCICDCGGETCVSGNNLKSQEVKSCGCLSHKLSRKDLTGQKFNLLTFIEFRFVKGSNAHWLCKCDCGTEKIMRAASVKSGNTKSCGCDKRENLIGQKFNSLVVIAFDSFGKHHRIKWLCRCDCGKEIKVFGPCLKCGDTKSCGCRNVIEDLIGHKFNKLTVKSHNYTKEGHTYWLCICDCGKTKTVSGRNLKNGHTKSCGCLLVSIMSKRRGRKHPSWNHSLSKKDRVENKNRNCDPRVKRWRTKCFKRDNYICQCCSSKIKIQVHHIYSWNKYKKLRFTVSNGVTFCTECHKEFHKKFGRGNNTRRQFTKFKKLNVTRKKR